MGNSTKKWSNEKENIKESWEYEGTICQKINNNEYEYPISLFTLKGNIFIKELQFYRRRNNNS